MLGISFGIAGTCDPRTTRPTVNAVSTRVHGERSTNRSVVYVGDVYAIGTCDWCGLVYPTVTGDVADHICMGPSNRNRYCVPSAIGDIRFL